MNLRNFLRKHLQNFLGRVYKNYQGQVAIFVALIFQIVFILFALMINVGLLVHHKINLQQSTDLAAYYGAMKQAEMLNVVSHVNFQIRQAYKLLTWRYRILGTFGMQRAGVADIQYPINHVPGGFAYNPASNDYVCPAPLGVGPADIPFMCLNHYGFKDYNAPPNANETFCKASCGNFAEAKTQINQLSTGATGGAGVWDVFEIGNFNTAITAANEKIAAACRATGPTTMALLAKFYVSYLQDVNNKKLFIKTLMANLSVDEKDQLDIEGNSILKGVTNTFKNNLTEANNASMNDNTFTTLNSLSPEHGGDCHYSDTSYRQKATDTNTAVALFSEINFDFIQYFILTCNQTDAAAAVNPNSKNFGAESIYDLQNIPNLNANLLNQLNSEAGSAMATRIKDIMEQNRSDHTMGIEKNPWCGVYYGVKATSTPIIPFLPISKVTLHASSFAQPFGGSIGPRVFREWTPESNRSQGTGGPATQTDLTLPLQTRAGSAPIITLKDNAKVLLNYSNYVGDTKGLADTRIVAAYHDMLLNKSVASESQPPVSSGKTPEPTKGRDFVKPEQWPAYAEWNDLTIDIAKPEYDPLARAENNNNSFMRDIELSVVAPNQFEATYYSIEPDFYNVYVKDKLEKSFDTLKSRVGLTGAKIYIPKDFGDTTQASGQTIVNGTPKHFSVRNQIAIVHHVMRAAASSSLPTQQSFSFPGSGKHSDGIGAISDMYFTYVPFLPGSLLTSWTMKDLVSDNYSVVTQEDTSMPFGQCLDEDLHGNDGYQSIGGQDDPRGGSDKLPPAPGNCIKGGRTGYSVKIVSPASLFGDRKLLGGSAAGPLRNPPEGFVSF